jgi:hypothetical protein
MRSDAFPGEIVDDVECPEAVREALPTASPHLQARATAVDVVDAS